MTEFRTFRTVTPHALVAGLASLIPVPFLYDWVLGGSGGAWSGLWPVTRISGRHRRRSR